jgi:hypothetical protein
MSGGFPNKPKILKGAFVEFGLSIPPLIVPFQFNPETIARDRYNYFSVPSGDQTLRQFYQQENNADLIRLRDTQSVSIDLETISFELRLDATDKLDEGDPITEQFGIEPQLSTLELMVHSKGESLLGEALGSLLGSSGGFSFTRGSNPPMILFIWGRKRVLPVNINSMSISETEFNTDLNPIRATVSVNLTVIEGKNMVYKYSKAMKEAMSVLNLANLTNIADVIIPG